MEAFGESTSNNCLHDENRCGTSTEVLKTFSTETTNFQATRYLSSQEDLQYVGEVCFKKLGNFYINHYKVLLHDFIKLATFLDL